MERATFFIPYEFQNSVTENENICNTQQNYIHISTVT